MCNIESRDLLEGLDGLLIIGLAVVFQLALLAF